MKSLLSITLLVTLCGCSYLNIKDGKAEGKVIDSSKKVGEELNRSGKILGKKLRNQDGEKLVCVKKEDCPDKK